MKYTVQVTLQAPDNDPVTMNWLNSGTALDAMHSIAQLLSDAERRDDSAFNPKTLSITITPTEG